MLYLAKKNCLNCHQTIFSVNTNFYVHSCILSLVIGCITIKAPLVVKAHPRGPIRRRIRTVVAKKL